MFNVYADYSVGKVRRSVGDPFFQEDSVSIFLNCDVKWSDLKSSKEQFWGNLEPNHA